MASNDKLLPFAVPLAGDRRPERLTLRLADGYEAGVYLHLPAGQAPKLPVLHVHGIQSHPGWFVGSARHLADLGYPVYQVTRRGSGDNASLRGHAASAGQLLDDVETAGRFVLDRAGAARLHLLGISWGGKLLAAYAARPDRRARIASLTLAAPGIAAKVDVPAATKLAIALALLACPRRHFKIPLNDVDLFTDNEAMRRYLRNDPCRLMTATAGLLYASRQLDRMLKAAPSGSLKAPVGLLLAREDRIIDNARTRQAIERLAGGNLRVKELASAHTMDFQADPSAYYDALAEAVARGD